MGKTYMPIKLMVAYATTLLSISCEYSENMHDLPTIIVFKCMPTI